MATSEDIKMAVDMGHEGDCAFTVPGELVHFTLVVCACEDCGCERAMNGFGSHKATTCFERPLRIHRERVVVS